MSQKTPPSTVALNKKARHLYELSEFTEAGIVLTGPEVKSIRAGKVNFIDSYVDFRQGEAWLVSLHIAPYANAGYVSQEPDRARKLLLHQRMALDAAIERVPVAPIRGLAGHPLQAILHAARDFLVQPGRSIHSTRMPALRGGRVQGGGELLFRHREGRIVGRSCKSRAR